MKSPTAVGTAEGGNGTTHTPNDDNDDDDDDEDEDEDDDDDDGEDNDVDDADGQDDDDNEDDADPKQQRQRQQQQQQQHENRQGQGQDQDQQKLSLQAKREKRLRMNRESARLRRRQKKDLLETLPVQVVRLENENKKLKRQNAELIERNRTLELELALLKATRAGNMGIGNEVAAVAAAAAAADSRGAISGLESASVPFFPPPSSLAAGTAGNVRGTAVSAFSAASAVSANTGELFLPRMKDPSPPPSSLASSVVGTGGDKDIASSSTNTDLQHMLLLQERHFQEQQARYKQSSRRQSLDNVDVARQQEQQFPTQQSQAPTQSQPETAATMGSPFLSQQQQYQVQWQYPQQDIASLLLAQQLQSQQQQQTAAAVPTLQQQQQQQQQHLLGNVSPSLLQQYLQINTFQQQQQNPKR